MLISLSHHENHNGAVSISQRPADYPVVLNDSEFKMASSEGDVRIYAHQRVNAWGWII